MIEESWGIAIEADFKTLEEAALRADHTLDSIEIDEPNEIKQAAHYCFWIRKLKPLKVFRYHSFQSAFMALSEAGKIRGSLDHIDIPDDPPARSIFINEMFSILVAIGIIRSGGYEIQLTAGQMNDLAVSLRYHSYSPSALGAIIGAHVENWTDHAPS